MKRFLSLLLAFALAAPTFAAEAPLVIQSGQIRKLPSATALQLSAPTTANSSINLPHGTAPTSPSNGDCWTTTAGLYCRISGATVGPYATGISAVAADNIVGNFTGSSAVPTSQALPSCSTSGYALTYNTSTHAIGCSSIGLSAIAADSILANLSGSSAVPSAATLPSCSGSNDALYYDTTTHAIGCHAPSGSGGGTVTSIATSGLVTGGTITGSGTIGLSSISAGYVVGNATGSSAVPTASTLSALIDQAIGSTQGQILYRGASAWSALSPGTSGQVLTTGGAGANPSWASGASYERSRSVPVVANFTLQNANSGTIADGASSSGIYFDSVNSTTGIRMIRLNGSPPSTPYSIIVRAQPIDAASGSYPVAIVLRNSSSGKIIIFGAYNLSQELVQKWTNYTTFSANIMGATSMWMSGLPVWRKVTNDGTTLTFSVSPDGRNWYDESTTTLSDFISSIDEIGMGAYITSVKTRSVFQSWEVN